MQSMQARHFLTFPFAYNVQTSPNGKYVCFQVTKANEKKNNYETNLWFYDTDSKHIGPLTASGKDSGFQFLEDGSILFRSGRGAEGKKDGAKGTTYYTICPRGGEAQKAFTVELSVIDIKPLKDDKYLVLGFEDLDHKSNYVEIEDLPFWSNGSSYTSGIRAGMYLFNASLAEEEASKAESKDGANNAGDDASKKEGEKAESKKDQGDEKQSKKNKQIESGVLTLLTQPFESVDAWDLHSDKNKVVFASSTYEHLMPIVSELYVLDLETKERKQISDKPASHYGVKWLEDKVLSNMSYGEVLGLNENTHFYLYDLEDKAPKKITNGDYDAAMNNSVGTDARFGGGPSLRVKDGKVYFLTTEKDSAKLNTLALDGTVTRVVDEAGTVETFDVTGDVVYFTAMRDLDLPELYKLEAGEETKLTNFSKALENIELSPVESFRYTTNGSEVTGYVITPVGHVPGQKAPGLLEVHGGPKTAYGPILHHEMQMLAAEGYFVFFTNPHGSDGYGDAFSDIRGKYGTIDYEDLMNFTDEVLKRYPDIDVERLGILGGSYGGFMTNWVVGHTDRFKAANAQRSISNWTSFYGVSDIGWYFGQDQTASNPWDNLDKMWEQSPLKYARNVKTPTLFIHADADYRCPLEQGIQMYAALQLQNVDTRLVVFKDENHELSRSGKPQGRLKRLEEISNWFKKYLNPTPNKG